MTRPIRRGAKFHIYYTYMYRLCQVKTEASIDPDAHGYASGSADAAATDFLPEVWANSFLAPSRRGVRPGVKERHSCRFGEQRPHRRGRGEKLYRSFYMR